MRIVFSVHMKDRAFRFGFIQDIYLILANMLPHLRLRLLFLVAIRMVYWRLTSMEILLLLWLPRLLSA